MSPRTKLFFQEMWQWFAWRPLPPRFARMRKSASGAFVGLVGLSLLSGALPWWATLPFALMVGSAIGSMLAEGMRGLIYARDARRTLDEIEAMQPSIDKAVQDGDIWRYNVLDKRRAELFQRFDRWMALADDKDGCDSGK